MRRTACYFPIVPNREGEITAVGHLSPNARARTRPIYEIDRPHGADSAELENHVAEAVRKISEVWGARHPILIDLPSYGTEHRVSNGLPVIEFAFTCLRQLGILAVPVTGPASARGADILEIVRGEALRSNRGVALRFPFAEFNNPEILERELDIATKLLTLDSTKIDLLFDLEVVQQLPPHQQSVAYLVSVVHEALAVIRKFGEFRNVILCGSSVPESVGKEYEATPYRGPRIEFDVWRELLPHTRIPVAFSDSGITPVRGDDPRGQGRAVARIRLSTPTEHVFHRAPRKMYVDLCKHVVASADFNMPLLAWGASKLRDCAKGHTQASSPARWVSRDTNLHIEATLVEIEKRLRAVGRISDYQFPKEETIAWLQQSMLESEVTP